MVIKRHFILNYACVLLCLISSSISFGSTPLASVSASSDYELLDDDVVGLDEDGYVDDFWCHDCYDPDCDCYYDYGYPGFYERRHYPYDYYDDYYDYGYPYFYESYYPVYIWRNGVRVREWRNRSTYGNRRNGHKVPVRGGRGRPVSTQPIRNQPVRTQPTSIRKHGGGGAGQRQLPRSRHEMRTSGARVVGGGGRHVSSSMGRSMSRPMAGGGGRSMGASRGGFSGGGRSMAGHGGGRPGGGRR